MGLPIIFGFLTVLQIMSWRTSSRGDRGKAPMYATSHRDVSFYEETASASDQAARVLQSHFDCKGGNPRPTGSIPMETWSRRQRLVETASVLFESRTVSNGAFSRCRPTRGRGPPEERCKPRTSL